MVHHVLDGSAKRVWGWMQMRFGVWYGEEDQLNCSSHVPAYEQQCIG